MEKKLEMAVVNSDCGYKNEKMERTGGSIENNKIGLMLFVICMCIYVCVGVRMYKHTHILNVFFI